MLLHPLSTNKSFKKFSFLVLNERGRYVAPRNGLKTLTDAREIPTIELPRFLSNHIVLPASVSDVFVWVHGWRTTLPGAIASAQLLFNGIMEVYNKRKAAYPGLDRFTPGFIAVHWPSMSLPGIRGYKKIRDRAKSLTDEGEAEFFLASLLGYLDAKNEREYGVTRKVLRARGGFYVHCVGHSFGGRFLTAAIRACASPRSPKTLSLVDEIGKGRRKVLSVIESGGFAFAVDSVLVFQMAAPVKGFGNELKCLISGALLQGPIVLTYSRLDTANCLWHNIVESEPGIGCSGAVEPREYVSKIELCGLHSEYANADLSTRIVNVDASSAFTRGNIAEGSHSDFWYEESIHLLLSIVNSVRSLS